MMYLIGAFLFGCVVYTVFNGLYEFVEVETDEPTTLEDHVTICWKMDKAA